MISNRRLSIIIPFYNVEQYIAQCLESVYDQDISESEYEVICVDDASPDNSIAIVEQYAKQHSNLTIIRNHVNRKLGGARNAGLDVAKGKYVWFVDSDDMVARNCLSKILFIAESQNLEILHFNYVDYPNINRLMFETEVVSGTELFFNSDFLWAHDLVTVWRKIYKRQFLLDKNIRFAEQVMFEDGDFALETFANAKRVKHIPDVIYLYRINQESITRTKYTAEHIQYLISLCHRLLMLKNRFLQEKKDIRYQNLIANYIKHTMQNVLNLYSALETKNKASSRQMILKSIDASLKPFIPRLMYYKIKLHLI